MSSIEECGRTRDQRARGGRPDAFLLQTHWAINPAAPAITPVTHLLTRSSTTTSAALGMDFVPHDSWGTFSNPVNAK